MFTVCHSPVDLHVALFNRRFASSVTITTWRHSSSSFSPSSKDHSAKTVHLPSYIYLVDLCFGNLIHWDERVWVERLFHCMVDSAPLKHLQIVPAYCWALKTYLYRVATVFSNITTLPVSPVQGMTDILLVAESSIALYKLLAPG
jgi:hypothetical protein